jgi:2-polyprenyl-3-methyl-5-hydroxy-6-metoxy-1,4-benzoquinol methylase
MTSQVVEIARGERFEFGKNWKQFLNNLDEPRILEAEKSLREMLHVEDLKGKSFLDAGSGSGIFSLAARRLGARVYSFDYDPESVACTTKLRQCYFSADPNWKVEEASVLDEAYMKGLGSFDIVYSWGVLHHTGRMWPALENTCHAVAKGGKLFIAIYNDMGWRSKLWWMIKRTYNSLPSFLKTPFVLLILIPGQTKALLQSIVTLRLREYIRSWSRYRENRGMSRWHDAVDWIGGYPYEFARPEDLIKFCEARGFRLAKMKPCEYKLACNELVFERD